LSRQHLASKVNLHPAVAADSLSRTTPLWCLACQLVLVLDSDLESHSKRLPNSAGKRRGLGFGLGLPHILVVRVRFASCRALQFKFRIPSSGARPAGQIYKEDSDTVNFSKEY